MDLRRGTFPSVVIAGRHAADHRQGPARWAQWTAFPARAAASPLFSAATAIAWLGEEIAWYRLAGIGAIFAGIALLSRSKA